MQACSSKGCVAQLQRVEGDTSLCGCARVAKGGRGAQGEQSGFGTCGRCRVAPYFEHSRGGGGSCAAQVEDPCSRQYKAVRGCTANTRPTPPPPPKPPNPHAGCSGRHPASRLPTQAHAHTLQPHSSLLRQRRRTAPSDKSTCGPQGVGGAKCALDTHTGGILDARLREQVDVTHCRRLGSTHHALWTHGACVCKHTGKSCTQVLAKRSNRRSRTPCVSMRAPCVSTQVNAPHAPPASPQAAVRAPTTHAAAPTSIVTTTISTPGGTVLQFVVQCAKEQCSHKHAVRSAHLQRIITVRPSTVTPPDKQVGELRSSPSPTLMLLHCDHSRPALCRATEQPREARTPTRSLLHAGWHAAYYCLRGLPLLVPSLLGGPPLLGGNWAYTSTALSALL